MPTLDEVRDEVRELEREIEELEQAVIGDELFDEEKAAAEGHDNVQLETIGQLDELLYDILNDKNGEMEMGEVVNGRRILRSKELQALHEEQIPKIQIENVYRFNAVTVFPISNDSEKSFIGIRFDVFNSYLKKFTTCHYIILKQFEIEIDGKERQIQEAERDIKSSHKWRWEIFQTTVPKYVPIGDVARDYLSDGHTRDLSPDTASIPSFNKINKFAMHIYEHLSVVEERKAFAFNLQDKYSGTSRVTVKFDLAVCRIEITLFGKKTSTTTKLVIDSSSTATKFTLRVGESGGADAGVAHKYWKDFCGAVNIMPDPKSVSVAVQKGIDTFLLQY